MCFYCIPIFFYKAALNLHLKKVKIFIWRQVLNNQRKRYQLKLRIEEKAGMSLLNKYSFLYKVNLSAMEWKKNALYEVWPLLSRPFSNILISQCIWNLLFWGSGCVEICCFEGVVVLKSAVSREWQCWNLLFRGSGCVEICCFEGVAVYKGDYCMHNWIIICLWPMKCICVLIVVSVFWLIVHIS